MADRNTMRDLVTLAVVARERSFTRAAAQFNVPRSALSYTIQSLEERIGFGQSRAPTLLLRKAPEHLLGQ